MKRHEQPPPGYFDDFLRQFQQRQREELLQRPLWQIVMDRCGAFFGELTVPRLAYAAATLAVLVAAGVTTYEGFRTSPEVEAIAAREQMALPAMTASYSPALGARPHYVMDARPVSYEPGFSF